MSFASFPSTDSVGLKGRRAAKKAHNKHVRQKNKQVCTLIRKGEEEKAERYEDRRSPDTYW